jgi:putative ABC transport system substrate-binding protein
MAGAAATFWPAKGQAQQSFPVIGFLSARSPAESAAVVAAFRKGFDEKGFEEGRSVAIAFRRAGAGIAGATYLCAAR